DQPRNSPKGRQMLDRLMCGSIFAIAHRLMCKDENAGQLHESRKPNRRARVIAEDEKRRPECPDLGQRKSVYDRRHRMFADAEMKILPAWIIRLKISRAFES